MTCCFFGHRDTPSEIAGALTSCVERLIREERVDTFLVGNEGSFDRMVYGVLQKLRISYPSITCLVVLAYRNSSTEAKPEDTIYPEGQEKALPRYAIDRRNRWMLKQADMVVSYVCSPVGGAARFAGLAARRGIRVIRLGTL